MSIKTLRISVLFATILVIILGSILAFFLSKNLSRPIKSLVKASEKIAKGDLDRRVEIKSHDEIGDLAVSFNKMTEDLKKAISSAIVKLLRPLIKIVLRNNIPYGTFVELAKWVYVDVASNKFSITGRKLTDSRIAIITGLTRKEVKRI